MGLGGTTTEINQSDLILSPRFFRIFSIFFQYYSHNILKDKISDLYNLDRDKCISLVDYNKLSMNRIIDLIRKLLAWLCKSHTHQGRNFFLINMYIFS